MPEVGLKKWSKRILFIWGFLYFVLAVLNAIFEWDLFIYYRKCMNVNSEKEMNVLIILPGLLTIFTTVLDLRCFFIIRQQRRMTLEFDKRGIPLKKVTLLDGART